MSAKPTRSGGNHTCHSNHFLKEGFREWIRRIHRYRARRRLKKMDQQRLPLLADLGLTAFQANIRSTGCEELWGRIHEISGNNRELTDALHQAKAALAKQKCLLAEERERWGQVLDQARVARKQAETAYQDLYQAVSGQIAADRHARQRLEAIHYELASLQAGEVSATSPDIASRMDVLRREQDQLTTYLNQIHAYLKDTQPQLQHLERTARLAAEQERKTRDERDHALTHLEAAVREAEQTQQDLSKKQQAVSSTLQAMLIELGSLTEQSIGTHPELTRPLERLRTHDSKRNQLAEEIASSEARSGQMPRGTLFRFHMVVIGAPLLLALLVLSSLAGYRSWQRLSAIQSLRARLKQASPISPYLNHPLKDHPAYRMADRLAEARARHDTATAETVLMDICRHIHLGIYKADGTRVLAGSERNGKDFFLYEFQQKLLATSYTNWNVTDARAHTRMIGRLVFRRDDLISFDRSFRDLLARRWTQAEKHPDRPENFLPLLIDGLARHQLVPYSLKELPDRPPESLDVDDIQSFLIFLDFFVPSPQRTVQSRQWLPRVYASSPCDQIAGDQAKGYWEGGSPLLGTLAGETAGKAGEAAGVAMDIIGLLGDILILRGIQLEIRPPGGQVISLPHVNKSKSDDSLPTYPFTAVATFQCEIKQEVADCGWLAGKQIPKSGPLKNVEITWDFDPPIGTHVAFHNGREFIANTRMLTNEQGEATVTLRAYPCPAPDGSQWLVESHVVTASARYVSAQMPNPLSAIGGPAMAAIGMLPGFYEVVTGGRKAYSRLDVNYHETAPDEDSY